MACLSHHESIYLDNSKPKIWGDRPRFTGHIPNGKDLFNPMMVFLLVLVLLAGGQSAQAVEQQQAANAEDCNTSRAKGYSEFGLAFHLVDDPSKFERNKVFLAVDKNGKPALYPILERDIRCARLEQHSLQDILAHWVPSAVRHGVYSFSFLYWSRCGEWRPARVDLRFRDNRCNRFRVSCDDTKIQSWLPARNIPKEVYHAGAKGNLRLPLFIGIVDGPRDMADHRTGPIREEYRKALSEGRCPLGARASAAANAAGG